MPGNNLEKVFDMGEATEIWTRIPVKDITSGPPVSGLVGMTVREIASKMVTSKVGSVIIVDDGKPVGIVTDRDLITKVLATDRRPYSIVAKEILSKPLITVDYDDEIMEAARGMRNHGVKRLGVMRRGELVGVISTSDIASVSPDLLDLVSEKIRISETETVPLRRRHTGDCDRCETWSSELEEINGSFVCAECLRIIYE